MVGTTQYLALGAVLFSIGVAGVFIRRNAIVVFMCIELMLNAVNLTFIALKPAARAALTARCLCFLS